LLDVTRISRGKIRLQQSPCDLTKLVERVVEDHQLSFVKAGVHLELSVEPAVPVTADIARIAQSLANVLQNALKFTDPGGSVDVSLTRDVGAGMAIVRVRDTGIGMSPEAIDQLFLPFAQAESSVRRSRGGLGLGLALVKGLVELHGGNVSAHSEGLGKGSEFVVRLPVCDLSAASAARAGRGKSSPKRVLIVEDDVDTADSLRDVLTLGGHIVEVANNGPDGLEKARAFKPHMLFCDIGLPGMDGYGVASAVRADPSFASVVLVALTGYATPEDLARAKRAGFDDHLAKPIEIAVLDSALAACSGDVE
jgi:CheY-like chemotaxis protein/two-component sensor histidine kinase